jgi:glycosyltransferase 2 family protein
MPLNNFLKFIGQFAVSGGLLYWVFRSVDGATLLQLLKTVSGFEMASLLVVMTALLGILQGYRWQRILLALGQRVETAWAINVSLLAFFFNQVIPAMVGGELARIWQGKRVGVDVQALIIGAMLDRFIGLFTIAFMCAVGLPALFQITDNTSVLMSDVVLVGLSAGGTGFIFSLKWLPPYFTRWRLFRGLVSLGSAAWRIASQSRHLWSLFALSVLSHSTQIASIIYLANLLGIPLEIGHALMLIPPILFVSMMPISISGWGVREGAMVVGLGLAGIPADSALAISILYGVLAIGVGALGGCCWLVYRLFSHDLAKTV